MIEIIIAGIGIFFGAIVSIGVYYRYSRELKKQKETLESQNVILQQTKDDNTNLKVNIQNEAQKSFEEWKQRELHSLEEQYKTQVENCATQYNCQLDETKKQIEENLKKKFDADFQQWKQDEEEKIRKDAIERSQSVIRGHVTEQLAPYLPEFNLNPKDARFIGSPLDFIVFDGLSEGDLKRIVIVEVKSGNSQVNQRERQVKKIIEKGLIEYREMRIQINKDEKNPEKKKENKESLEPIINDKDEELTQEMIDKLTRGEVKSQ